MTGRARHRGPRLLDLSPRDEAVLASVRTYGLLSAGHIERLLFTDHDSPVAARRRCQAVLRRLVEVELLERLDRRQGGWRAGSTGFTYRLTTRGRRILGESGRGGRTDPSERHQAHLHDIAELAVALTEAERRSELRDLTLIHEPEAWRRFVGPHGGLEVLRPDLEVELTTNEGWALRWWVEIDRGTEHLPTVLRKCEQYERYWRSGHEAQHHEVFPRICWSVPDDRRATAVWGAIERRRLTPGMFAVAVSDAAIAVLLRPPGESTTN